MPEAEKISRIARAPQTTPDGPVLDAVEALTQKISHDFNNILSQISLALDLAGKRAEDEQVVFCLEAARTAAASGAEMTAALQAFQGYLQKDWSRGALRDVLDAAAREAREAFGDGVCLKVDCKPEGLEIECHLGAAQTAIAGLVRNSFEAFARSGVGSSVSVSGAFDGAMVVIAVVDDGPGVPPQIGDLAVVPFVTEKEPSGPVGLGLWQAHGFAKSSGGHLRLSDAPGGGTRAEIALPAVR